MAKFVITALDPQTNTAVPLLYNNMDSSLTDLKGQSVIRTVDPALQAPHPAAPVTTRESPLGKTSPRILKISLGLSCNYACEYCSQRFVARNDETNPEDVTGFMASLDSWVASVRNRMMSFVNSIRFNRPASSLGQKCGMDKSDSIAVDLKGNVLTCQNVSARSTAPNGESHRIGYVSDLASVALRTSTHWSKRAECPQCPVLQICKGACMFLEGPLWERSCDNAYSDALPIFAAGIESLTGLIPVHIEGEFRSDRKDIFGLSDQPVTPQEIKAKPFPIPVVSA